MIVFMCFPAFDAASRGIAGADFDVVHYGLASTPAMFNSTLTKNEDIMSS
ncbi:hypothetical protein HanPI659440_Chr05g0213311 [Helianthus annuus]|nr:hypothetical protein HanPI659440_Chr05g0213311 [Helianthus annuus]